MVPPDGASPTVTMTNPLFVVPPAFVTEKL